MEGNEAGRPVDQRVCRSAVAGDSSRRAHSGRVPVRLACCRRGTLTGLLHTERLDLIWLNHANAGVAFSVIRDGRLLRYADADRLNEFERRAIWRYRDRVLYLQGRRNRRDGVSA